MPATSIQSPFPIFTDIDGQPLEQGQVWLGTAGNNPISSPITAYWDAALTQVVTQPVTTRGGYPLNGTAVGRLYVNADFSILVRNRRGYDVLSALSATERFDSSLVTFVQAGLGAVVRTAQAKMRDIVSVKDFGAVGDGVTDDTVAIQAAINAISSAGGGTVVFPSGGYKITSSLTIPSYVTLSGHGKGNTKLLRAFSGDFVTSMGGYAGIEYLTIDGQTSTYGSGRGVLLATTSPSSYAFQTEITNFSQACLEFAADTGATFRASQCDFYTTGAVGSVAAVRVNGTDTTATSRHFTDCESGGCTLFDFGGANDVYVSGGYSAGLIFGAASSKVMIVNMRIGNLATTTVAGSSHRIRNCVFAAAVTLTCINSTFHNEVPAYAITDNGTGNDVYIASSSYTPTWSATGGGASLGNGSIAARWSRQGGLVDFQIDFTIGSTTNVGSGAWEFTLPVPDSAAGPVQMCGVGFASDASATNSTVFAVRVSPGGQKVQGFFGANGTGAPSNLGAAAPAATWGAGASIRLSGRYYTT